ncbi:MAG: type II secretion system F family protein, partial [Alphaproteobacteria bacterium]
IRFILDQGFEVPLHTRALIAVSGAFQNYWYVIFGIPAIVFLVTLTIYRNHEPFAYWVDARLIRLPVFGEVIRKINMARFVHFFSVMFKSGIDIPEALTVARGVVGNRVIKESIDLVNRSVIEGNNLTSSLRISSQFPTLVIRMFKVGEDSGNMSEALENINFFYHREVNDSVDSLVGIVQPALTIIMGGLIFWVIAAVFGPLYQSFSKMKY